MSEATSAPPSPVVVLTEALALMPVDDWMPGPSIAVLCVAALERAGYVLMTERELEEQYVAPIERVAALVNNLEIPR